MNILGAYSLINSRKVYRYQSREYMEAYIYIYIFSSFHGISEGDPTSNYSIFISISI